jgi:hypothetical protein
MLHALHVVVGPLTYTTLMISCLAIVGRNDGEDDPFGTDNKQRLSFSALARRNGLPSAASLTHFMDKFGSISRKEESSVYQISEKQQHLLKTTVALCALRSNGNSVTAEMGAAILSSMKPSSPAEVCSLIYSVPPRNYSFRSLCNGDILYSRAVSFTWDRLYVVLVDNGALWSNELLVTARVHGAGDESVSGDRLQSAECEV